MTDETRSSFKPGSTEVVALEADYIDSGLNNFLKQVVTTYTRLPVTMDTPVCINPMRLAGILLTSPLF